MGKEWFSLNELRATGLPDISEPLTRRLAALFGEMPDDLARCRAGTLEVEYHVRCLPASLQLQIRAQADAGIKDRIRKLGICRPVVDQNSRYEADVSEEELNALSARIRRHHEERGA